MFRGFNTTDAVNTISLLCGFIIIFSGVYLLNLSRKDPIGDTLLGSAVPGRHGGFEDTAIPTDSMTAFGTRLSMQARSSIDGSTRHSRAHSWGSNAGPRDREALMADFALSELAENDDGDDMGSEAELAAKELLPNGDHHHHHHHHHHHSSRIPDEELAVRAPAANTAPRLSGSGRVRVDNKDSRKPPPGGGDGGKSDEK
jgi:hypothetical protein